jgi:guanine nucleotide-binding protein subunit beta-2-like 1 protein
MAGETTQTLKYKGFLKGHGGWVTSIAVGEEKRADDKTVEFLLTGSRDRNLIKWELDEKKDDDEDREWGRPKKLLSGHSHFISQVCLTQDHRFAFSSSWDGTIRIWNLATGTTHQQLIGHKKDVLSFDISHMNHIVSGSLDTQIKLWNVNGECKSTFDRNTHTDAVSCVKFYNGNKQPLLVTASWDKTIKVWDASYYGQLIYNFTGHKAQINSIDMVQNSSYLASGSRDGTTMVWDLINGKFLTSYDCESPVNVVLFSQKLYWLIIGTDEGIKVLDLPSRSILQNIQETSMNANDIQQGSKKHLGCTALAWNKSGNIIYSGWTDNNIRVYKLESAEQQ